jgi:hypothetical protein
MKSLESQVEVSHDGKLRVEVSTDLPPGPVEGVILVQPAKRPQPPPYDTLEGAFAGQLPDIDVDDDAREVSAGAATQRAVPFAILPTPPIR